MTNAELMQATLIALSTPRRFPMWCLTFRSNEEFKIYAASEGFDRNFEYSTDARLWTPWPGSTSSNPMRSANGLLFVRGSGNTAVTGSTNRWVCDFINPAHTPVIDCFGNVETLLNWQTVARGGHPAIGWHCCDQMFYGWEYLRTAPRLSSTALATYCYRRMFQNCRSLIHAPDLPAETVPSSAYESMFSGCTALETAPHIAAKTVGPSAMKNMFINCTALKSVPDLEATDISEDGDTQGPFYGMFQGCTALKRPPALPLTFVGAKKYSGHEVCREMFKNCVSLEAMPRLLYKKFSYSSCKEMFAGCTALKVSETQTEECPYSFTVPDGGGGSLVAGSALDDMFTGTGGTFTGTPVINTTYYTNSPLV